MISALFQRRRRRLKHANAVYAMHLVSEMVNPLVILTETNGNESVRKCSTVVRKKPKVFTVFSGVIV